jgi:hypothetical protein
MGHLVLWWRGLWGNASCVICTATHVARGDLVGVHIELVGDCGGLIETFC